MIPSKLYIPTTTLNLNNIMSSESISPASFYERRGFGYKRFTKVEPNNLENRIVLYEKYPVFDIPDQDLENYPLVVEIDTKSLNEDVVQEQNGQFFADETIYLNPFSTRIIFRNEQEKVSTLSKAEPSIETKMVAIYENCFCIKNNDFESFEWQKTKLEDASADLSKHISKDRKINKLKGFLFAYILAAHKSLSSDVVALKKYAKELKNILSAIITSPDGQATYQQKEHLNGIYKAINDAFYKAEELDKKTAEIRKSINDEFFKEGKLEEFLKRFGAEWIEKLYPKSSYQLRPFLDNQKDKEKAFEDYVIELEKQIDRFLPKAFILKEDFPELQNCNRIESIPKFNVVNPVFLSNLFNEYLEEAYNGQDFVQSRYDFARCGGKIFKEKIQEKEQWEGSPSQKYINTLLKNLNEHSQFVLKSTDNLTLQSFAAFCQKGEDDIDKLEDYLISNEIGDFRIAFALWGIVFGFVNMPKTLTNDLFLSDDLDYVSEVYKYIFKQVHGIELEGKLEKQQQKEVDTSQSDIQKEEESLQKTTVRTDVGGSDIINKLKGCKLKPEQLEIVSEIYKTNNCKIDGKFFSEVGKVKGIGVKKLEKIKECFGFKTNEAPSQMFSHESFLNDFNFLSHNEKFINIVSKHKDWKDDLKWFIESHGKTHKDFAKYWKDKPTDNESVIKQFIFLKKERYKETEELLKSLYLHNER